MAPTKKTSGKSTKKTSPKPKKAKAKPKAPEPEPEVPAGAVVLWHPHRNRRVKVPGDIVEDGFVRFVNHELVIDPEVMGADKAKALLDHLWEHGYRPKPTEAEVSKPELG